MTPREQALVEAARAVKAAMGWGEGWWKLEKLDEARPLILAALSQYEDKETDNG
jgi:hypothetical protein